MYNIKIQDHIYSMMDMPTDNQLAVGQENTLRMFDHLDQLMAKKQVCCF